MTATITNWPLTPELFLSLPEAEPALEMAPNGGISQKALPTTKHAALQGELILRLETYARAHALGHAFPEHRVILARIARIPHVTFYRQERLPLDAAGEYVDCPTTPPDLIVEIYSPVHEDRRDLALKAAWYVEQGVRIVLLVDPDRRRVTSFTAKAEAVFESTQPLPPGRHSARPPVNPRRALLRARPVTVAHDFYEELQQRSKRRQPHLRARPGSGQPGQRRPAVTLRAEASPRAEQPRSA